MLAITPRITRALGRGPLTPAHANALAEILHGPGLLSESEIEGRATAAHDRLAAPVDHPHPRLLARGNGLRVRREPGLARDGLYLLGTIYYRPEANARAEGWTLYHELAHGLLDGLAHTHADVQRLALALTAPRAWVVSAFRRHHVAVAKRRLVSANTHAPAPMLRLRVERVMLSAHAE